MHIAICMDDAADRKQLERLLKRSTDKRISEDVDFPFYIQSFGNSEAVLRRPLMYDLFFIDLLGDEKNSIELIRELRSKSVTATIVLCPSKIDLSNLLTKEDEVLILNQPIKAAELDERIDVAVAEVKSRVPMIEICGREKRIKVLPEEIQYIEKKRDIIEAHLSEGRIVECPESLSNMWDRICSFDKIFNLPDKLIVNSDYVEKIGYASVTLKNGEKYTVNRKWLKYMVAHLDK